MKKKEIDLFNILLGLIIGCIIGYFIFSQVKPSNNPEETNKVTNEEIYGTVYTIQLGSNTNKDNLNQTINSIVTDTKKMKTMGENALKQAVYNVEDKIYKEIKDTLKNF